MARPLAVFCDFDGTITERDMVVSICERFCPPAWKDVARDILARKKTLKDGVAELFAMIPSSKKDAVIAYAHEVVRYRAGFEEFLTFCRTNGLKFTVCSGGIDFFIRPLLAPFQDRIDRIVDIPSDFSGKFIALKHTNACETEGTCKLKVMQEYPESFSILIGDSITDLHGARSANRVYARDKLKTYLDEEKIAYHSFETFHDIIADLSAFAGSTHEKQPC